MTRPSLCDDRPSLPVRLLGWAGFTLLALVACELGSRADDWFFQGVPFLGNPGYEDLFFVDEYGMRSGRPGTHWSKVRLNNFGMRGPDVPPTPGRGCTRWMFLGSSETFGEPAVADKEYPARVRALAPARSCLEVLNYAFPGRDVRTLTGYYRIGVGKYFPQVVFIYPPTHFYLGELSSRDIPKRLPEAERQRRSAARTIGLLERFRFIGRLRDSIEIPAPLQRLRVQRWIDAQSAGKPPDWFFNDVPEERLDLMEEDLRELVKVIRDSGAEPVLMTHAVRVTERPRNEDLADLFAMRVYIPRASETALAAFEYAAAQRIRELGASSGIRVIDIASLLNGKRDRFIDLVHFAPQGSDEVAQLILREMGSGSKQGTAANALQ